MSFSAKTIFRPFCSQLYFLNLLYQPLHAVHASSVIEWYLSCFFSWSGILFPFLFLLQSKRQHHERIICFPDSLRYTSALSVGLAIVFVVIIAGVAIVKLINGSIAMPQLLPNVVDQASFWKLFTTVPILVTAYICHHNSKFVRTF